MDMAWLLKGVSPKPESHARERDVAEPPRVRDNNAALQVRLRLDRRDHFSNRLGRWDDPVAQARGGHETIFL